MAHTVVARQGITVGTPVVIEAVAPASAYSVVFEDERSTGYLYALDGSRGENPIVDALHIYNLASVTDKHLASEVEVAWSSDSQNGLARFGD